MGFLFFLIFRLLPVLLRGFLLMVYVACGRR